MQSHLISSLISHLDCQTYSYALQLSVANCPNKTVYTPIKLWSFNKKYLWPVAKQIIWILTEKNLKDMYRFRKIYFLHYTLFHKKSNINLSIFPGAPGSVTLT